MEAESSKTLREERVLLLLNLLGKDATAEVLPHLDAQVAAMIRQRLPEFATRVTPVRKQKAVLDEFERYLQFTRDNAPPELKLHTEEDEGEDDDIPIEVELTGDPLIDIDRMNIHQLTAALEEEQPRTVALLLKCVSPRRIAEILELMPESKKQLIVREFSYDPKAPEPILRRIAGATITRAKQFPTEPRVKDDPVSRLVEVLRATEKAKRREILKAIEEQNPDQATLINQSLYQFEDLLTMDDQQIQKVLARVDSSTLSTALFNSDERIVDKILGNLSKRARASLQEELGFRKNVTGAQLRASRQLVTAAIAEAEQESE